MILKETRYYSLYMITIQTEDLLTASGVQIFNVEKYEIIMNICLTTSVIYHSSCIGIIGITIVMFT